MLKKDFDQKRRELQQAIWEAEDRVLDLQMQIASANRELLRLNYEEKKLNESISNPTL